MRPEETVCSHCEHRLVNHGDRAIAACDGGYTGMQASRVGQGRGYCQCPGWKPGESLATVY